VGTGFSGRERSQDRGFDKGWVAHRREVDEAHAIGETAFGPLRDRQRHARFADASHPGKRQQTNVGAEQLFVQRGDLAVATNEWRWLRWELCGHGDRPSLRGHATPRHVTIRLRLRRGTHSVPTIRIELGDTSRRKPRKSGR
jgi:hypothetical protein